MRCRLSAVTTYGCAQNFCLKMESNYYTRFITFAVVGLPKRDNEWRGPTSRLSAWATQLRRNVATVASRWL